MGFDDDGDAGSGWFYPGQVTTTSSGAEEYDFDLRACEEVIDINPADESGGDNPGVAGSAQILILL